VSEVQEIAESLLPSERRALMQHRPMREWPETARHPLSFNRAGRNLMQDKLIKWPEDYRDSRTFITPLGEAVRAHLQATQGE
jgi:hypothetical protein